MPTDSIDAVKKLLKELRWMEHDSVSFKIDDSKDAERRDLPFFSCRHGRAVIGPTWTTMYVKDNSSSLKCLDSVKTDDLKAVRRFAKEIVNFA